MDFHAAMETFAEAWIAANMQNYASSPANKNETTAKKDILSNKSIKNKVYMNLAESYSNSKSNADVLITVATKGSVSLRCVVEQECIERTYHDVEPDHVVNVINDSVLSLPGSLLFFDVVKSSLLKLGFSISDVHDAKGKLQVKNWNELDIESLTSDDKMTLEKMLGHISLFCTLKIRLKSIDIDKIEWDDQTVRCAIIKLLKQYNQITLAKMCPMPQSMISNIVNSKYTAKVCAEKCKEFGNWYKKFRQENTCSYFCKHHSSSINLGPAKKDQSQLKLRQSEIKNICDFELTDGHRKTVPAIGTNISNQLNTRMTFHPVDELPLMRSWYKFCPNPTSEELKNYLHELNVSPIRQERPKISLKRLRIWWRNEKQRVKKVDDQVVENGDSHLSDESLNGRKKRQKRRISLSSEEKITKMPSLLSNNNNMNSSELYLLNSSESQIKLVSLHNNGLNLNRANEYPKPYGWYEFGQYFLIMTFRNYLTEQLSS
ncbi:hypothetical protein HELRODRAFT_165862 [Helobdella robusta]|uniref:Uncharacterized protein n=1 Tax=Helobdella robusta TaxID=6412 RepID=T1EXD5_HELRO|nr:hypothetical protein HELRODRAFT_165862 [Helobdella robusta]ESN91785.1 hypothetical protein HELRODRAFT_165862 [Helobdella robusta]